MQILNSVLIFTFFSVLNLSCEKEHSDAESPYDLDVFLHGVNTKSGHGQKKPSGYIKFRQDPNPEKVINLDIWVRDLEPNHEYLLQRAVDPANVVDGDCTSTTWLTLGKGLISQSIFTDAGSDGYEALWRDVSAVTSGSAFDIHFQVVDAANMAVVLTSDCYKYVVR